MSRTDLVGERNGAAVDRFRLRWVAHGSPLCEACVTLRRAVLRRPLGLDYSEEELAEESTQWHLAACDGRGLVVGCLLVVPAVEAETAKVRQVAVAESVRGQGLGRRLMREAETRIASEGFDEVVLHAREEAVPFYRGLGYEAEGERFREIGLLHVRMRRRLPHPARCEHRLTRGALPVSVSDMSPELEAAVAAAREAGEVLRENFESDLHVDEMLEHDIKLRLDVECQDLITRRLLDAFPHHAIYGEEGIAGDQDSDHQWIVDPIDGTVNFFYGIPHFCISIALRVGDELVVGAIYDPTLDEMFAVDHEGPATRNGTPVSPSRREELGQAVVTVGFSKTKEGMDAGLARYKKVAYQVRKTRMLGSAALALAYIACGRLDAYIEEQISIWDIAAGKIMVERGGGRIEMAASHSHPDKSSIVASNGLLPLGDVL